MIIPDKNLFIVSSSIKPMLGVFSHEERFKQTIESMKSIRKHVPDAIILSADASIEPLTEEEKDTIAKYANIYLDLSDEPNTRKFSQLGLKSHAENTLLFATLMTLKHNPNLSQVLPHVKRIFKFGARTELEDTFDIKEYDNLFGKFVFKKRIPTWMGEIQHGADHLLITRMFSFCPSLIDTYLEVIQKNMNILLPLDTEHAHFVNIPKEHLVEFDKIHCWGWMAASGDVEHY